MMKTKRHLWHFVFIESVSLFSYLSANFSHSAPSSPPCFFNRDKRELSGWFVSKDCVSHRKVFGICHENDLQRPIRDSDRSSSVPVG